MLWIVEKNSEINGLFHDPFDREKSLKHQQKTICTLYDWFQINAAESIDYWVINLLISTFRIDENQFSPWVLIRWTRAMEGPDPVSTHALQGDIR